NKLNKLALYLITVLSASHSISVLAQDTDSSYTAYVTSWGLSDPAALNDTQADTIMLSFGAWDFDGNISTSDGIADIPVYNEYWLQPSYMAWTNFKFDNPDKKVLISFGGQTYESIWSYIQTPEQREKLAANLTALRGKKFPVYKKGLNESDIVGDCLSLTWNGQCNTNNYQLAGYVQIDGFDFDFEKGARLTPTENENLLEFVKLLRQYQVDQTTLALTTYHVGADNPDCADNSVTKECSFIENDRSVHHGEVIDLLKKSGGLFDKFNVMAYDAGRQFKWDVAMENYAKYVGDKSKVVLGTTINKQWAPEGNFTETKENNLARAKWQAENGYGGLFVWAFGSNTDQLSMKDQVSYFNDLIDVSENNVGESKPVVDRKDSVTISGNSALRNMSQDSNVLAGLLDQYKQVIIRTANGNWAGTFTLPEEAAEGSVVQLQVNSDWAVILRVSGTSYGYGKGNRITMQFVDGRWVNQAALNITTDSALRSISNQPDLILDYLNKTAKRSITLTTSNNNWAKNFELPNEAKEGDLVTFTRRSAWPFDVKVSGDVYTIADKTQITFQYTGGAWLKKGFEISLSDAMGLLNSSPKDFIELLQNAKNKNASVLIK
ncbi:glycosyl hydrolase family 18 protein, partial [Vibrio metoecus]|uniref:glycosyl hydrolase family 18 protein n=1 Tax=Vibrio metoecus TaxID=1481663 RepID=UPI00215C6208